MKKLNLEDVYDPYMFINDHKHIIELILINEENKEELLKVIDYNDFLKELDEYYNKKARDHHLILCWFGMKDNKRVYRLEKEREELFDFSDEFEIKYKLSEHEHALAII